MHGATLSAMALNSASDRGSLRKYSQPISGFRRLGVCARPEAGVHPAGEAGAERLRRKLQRQLRRRVPEPALVSEAWRMRNA
ncbi:MAG: hypothetical protein AVDCRST_MAG68-1363 [uncultured Gemmatimonadetes bacterium]|uniref:Uncharacterized protein n=1 Tax=uncultured Gemmatimonadota bacterium TaxID=203437 RepID=A0A6J4KWD0_9BACT|nr:MAG: hypothetical protein AVDCRST_MAG68-1363 [uncultured Gemmatimonadota bacterium]